jgi:uncharacterized membrane protein YkvI
MKFMDTRFFRVYLVPGIILQSVIVAGGYGTGRELVEFFTQYGPIGGLLGMVIAIIFFAVVTTVTYEFARLFQVYDYRTFFKKLLGPGFIVYEIVYILLLILVLAVIGSAAGTILQNYFNIPYAVGMAGMIILVGILNFYGRETITKSLAYWSFVLYAIFIIYFIAAISRFGGLGQGEIMPGWALGGFRYSWYNLAIVPAILFSTRAIETRREAITAGIIAPFIVMIPAFLFHLTFMGTYPDIINQDLPVYWIIGQLGLTWLLIIYIIGLFGTFIETGAGFIQGVIERIDAYLEETKGTTLSKPLRGVIGVGSILLAVILGTVGIVGLIGKGYGTMSWAFFIVYIIPLLTYGIYQIVKQKNKASARV